MRLRIAILLVVMFALAGISAATASAASSVAYGTCYITANAPAVSGSNVVGQARISCGSTMTLTYDVCTNRTRTDRNCHKYTTTVNGGTAVIRDGAPLVGQNNVEYFTEVLFYGYDLLSDVYRWANGQLYYVRNP
jgi:hypothetical protein